MDEKIYSDVLAGAPFLQSAVVKFLQLLPIRAEEMETALRDGKLEDVATIAHRLKGAGGTHGYPILSEAARSLEKAARGEDQTRTAALIAEFRALLGRMVAEPPPG